MRDYMKKIVLLLVFAGIILLLISIHLQSQAKNVLVIVSKDAEFYTKPLEGFRRSCRHQVSSITLTSDASENARLIQNARNIRANLILLIGSGAAKSFTPIPSNVPVIYCMILQPEALGLTGSNITGVSLEIPHSVKLEYLKRLSPNVKRIGLLYNANNVNEIVNDMARASAAADIELFTAAVNSSAEISNALKGFKDTVDALYLPQDRTLLEKRAFEYITLFSIQNRIALVIPTAKFVKMGGLMAADVDLVGIGRQVGNIANRIIAGSNPAAIPPEKPKEFVLALNARVASLIGLEIPPSLMNNAKIYN